MKSALLTSLLVSCTLYGQLSAAEYKGDGYSFSYNDKLQIIKTGKAVKTIRVTTKDGTQFMVQNYKKLANPNQIKKLMLSSLTKKFGNNCTQAPNKSMNRMLLGANRSGFILYIHPSPKALIECAVFTFEKDGNTFCVITQQLVGKTLEAEQYFREIQNSLKMSPKL